MRGLRDNVWTGFALGITVPGVLLSLIWYAMHRFAFLAKADLLLIAGIAVNAIFMHYFFRHNKESAARGIISATFIWAFIFFFYKINQ